MKGRVFTYEEAVTALERIKPLTRDAQARLEELRRQAEAAPPGSRRARKLSEWINTVAQRWAEQVASLGALPKGLWTVDFDSGQGYFYCWTLNEADLAYYHGYDEGFMGRKPLTDAEPPTPPLLLS